jgi:hypothetical protein
MTTTLWLSRIVAGLFAFAIYNGWQHGHYPFQFAALIAVGAMAMWVNGWMEARR